MHVHLVAVGQKMPAWVTTACDDYLKRLPREIAFAIKEIPLAKRGKHPDIERAKREECEAILAALPRDCELVALDVTGKALSTEELAGELDNWMREGRDVALVIGGPDGFSKEFLQTAQRRISLSAMTFPHPLVRVIMVEQLYRAWSILNKHPYHRA